MRYLLLIFAVLVLWVGANMIQRQERHLWLETIPRQMQATREQIRAMVPYLKDYAKFTGHYPSNDEGLLAVEALVAECEVEKSLGSKLCHCQVLPSGIVTLWREPFIYENRRGMDERLFRDSGATVDKDRRYSVRVDEGVYIWSLAAQQEYEKYRIWRPKLTLAWQLTILTSALLMVLSVITIYRHDRANQLSRIHSGAWALTLAIFFCGVAAVLVPVSKVHVDRLLSMSLRTPELTHDYVSLMSTYRDRGIISNECYRSIKQALQDDSRYFKQLPNKDAALRSRPL